MAYFEVVWCVVICEILNQTWDFQKHDYWFETPFQIWLFCGIYVKFQGCNLFIDRLSTCCSPGTLEPTLSEPYRPTLYDTSYP